MYYNSDYEEQQYNCEHLNDLKRIANFRLLDDEYMTKFFDKHEECIELVLSIILNDPNLKVEHNMSQTQYVIANLHGKEIRLDIHAIDTDYTEYDVEIQRADYGAGAKRARLNSSILDANHKDAGEYGSKLTDTYVIFITENDVWGEGLAFYEIERYVNGKKYFNDGAHIIYVNGAYDNDDMPIGRLMHDFRCIKSDEMYYKVLADRTIELKETEEGVANMCKELEKMRNEAELKGIIKTAVNMLKKKLSVETVAECTELSIEEIIAIGKKHALL